jgi:hypothetical protein
MLIEEETMKSICAIAIIVLILSACSRSSESLTVSEAATASMITLEKAVHFSAPDGAPLAVDPGDYVIAPGDRSLRLNLLGSESTILVAASSGTHEKKVATPTALSFAEEGAEHADIHHIVLLLPDGKSLDAAGSYSGIATRGLKERLAQRPLVQKAIQAKENIQARVHDRLFGPPPPFSLGPNAIPLVFNENAVGPAPGNAYLLTYLAALIYPEFLDQLSGDPLKQDTAYVERLHKIPQDFVQEYADRTHHLFWNSTVPPGTENQPPQYVWVWGSRGGQDPEAMVISTPKTVFVVFRGTDRVAQAKKKFGYNWAEWVQTDFVALGVSPGVGSLRGLVHAGFWLSLTAPATLYVPQNAQVPGGIPNGLPFREATLAVIKAFGGGSKKVWVTGHSLGAAHVQLYGAYLSTNGLSPQGVYALAAPHVGDRTFVDQLNGMFPNQRLQRFDFVNDPVTKVPPHIPMPQTPGKPPITYERAGTRVYYDDVKTIQFGAPERPPMDLPVRLPLALAPGDFCFHYPQWHMNAAYAHLDQATASRVPSPLPTPVMRGDVYSWLCGPLHITRGNVSPRTVLGNVLPGR